MNLGTVNEGSKRTLTVDLLAQGVLTAPTTLRYKINCRTTDTELVSWTSVTPGTQVEITVLPSTNRIISDVNLYEVKVITLEANAGTDDAFTQEVDWRVKNLQFID